MGSKKKKPPFKNPASAALIDVIKAGDFDDDLAKIKRVITSRAYSVQRERSLATHAETKRRAEANAEALKEWNVGDHAIVVDPQANGKYVIGAEVLIEEISRYGWLKCKVLDLPHAHHFGKIKVDSVTSFEPTQLGPVNTDEIDAMVAQIRKQYENDDTSPITTNQGA